MDGIMIHFVGGVVSRTLKLLQREKDMMIGLLPSVLLKPLFIRGHGGS